MVEDGANRIWVGTESGVCRYDPETEQFTDIILHNEAGEVINKPIIILERDALGNIWLVTETKEVFCYDPKSDDIECRYRASNSIPVLRSDPRGRIWFFELDRGLFRPTTIFKTSNASSSPIPLKSTYTTACRICVSTILIECMSDSKPKV